MYFLKRWYDKDPRLSLAVGCIEKANSFSRKRIARLIIQKAKTYNVVVKDPHIGLFKRWYDEDRTLSIAMEYFKAAPPEIQRKIANIIVINLTENCQVG